MCVPVCVGVLLCTKDTKVQLERDEVIQGRGMNQNCPSAASVPPVPTQYETRQRQCSASYDPGRSRECRLERSIQRVIGTTAEVECKRVIRTTAEVECERVIRTTAEVEWESS